MKIMALILATIFLFSCGTKPHISKNSQSSAPTSTKTETPPPEVPETNKSATQSTPLKEAANTETVSLPTFEAKPLAAPPAEPVKLEHHSFEGPTHSLGGMCAEVKEKDLATIAGLGGVYQHRMRKDKTGAPRYTQFTLEPDGHYKVVQGTSFKPGQGSSQGDVAGTPEFVAFIALEEQTSENSAFYVGVVNTDSAQTIKDDIGHPNHSLKFSKCYFMILQKTEQEFWYGPLSVKISNSSDLGDLEQSIRLSGSTIKSTGNEIFIAEGTQWFDSYRLKGLLKYDEFLGHMAVADKTFLSSSLSQSQTVVDAKEHYRTGKRYLKENELNKALEEFEKAIRSNPSDVHAHVAVAGTLIRLEKFDDAFDHANQATRLHKEVRDPYIIRGIVYEQKGKIDLAIKEYEQAHELKPQDGLSGFLTFLLARRTDQFLWEGYNGCKMAKEANSDYTPCWDIAESWVPEIQARHQQKEMERNNRLGNPYDRTPNTRRTSAETIKNFWSGLAGLIITGAVIGALVDSGDYSPSKASEALQKMEQDQRNFHKRMQEHELGMTPGTLGAP